MPTLISSGDARIDELVRRIVDGFAPLRVILFGSRARGDNRPDSDVDLMVVIPDEADRRATVKGILRAIRDVPVERDLIVVRAETIRRKGHVIGLVYREALEEGKVLYDGS